MHNWIELDDKNSLGFKNGGSIKRSVNLLQGSYQLFALFCLPCIEKSVQNNNKKVD